MISTLVGGLVGLALGVAVLEVQIVLRKRKRAKYWLNRLDERMKGLQE